MISNLSIQCRSFVSQLITLPLYLRTFVTVLDRMACRKPVRSQSRGRGIRRSGRGCGLADDPRNAMACLFRGSDSTASNQIRRSAFCLSMIYSENRFAGFGIMFWGDATRLSVSAAARAYVGETAS